MGGVVNETVSSGNGIVDTAIVNKSLDKGFEILDIIHTAAGLVSMLLFISVIVS